VAVRCAEIAVTFLQQQWWSKETGFQNIAWISMVPSD
jgi:hypothetical protein